MSILNRLAYEMPFRHFDENADGAGGAAAGAAGNAGGAGAAAAAGAAGGADGAGGDAGAAGGAAGAAAAGGAATLAGGGADTNAAAAAALMPGELPAGFDFRKYLAGDDPDAAKDLAKHTDLRSIYKGYRDLQAEVSKRGLKPVGLPENATDQQRAEWRKANGLPENAEAMVSSLKLPDGVVVGEADKPLVQSFAEAMFKDGATQAEMNRAVSWYYAMADQQKAALEMADGDHKQQATEHLMQDWGPQDFKVNMNAVSSVLATMPEEDRATLLTARTADGRMLGNTPELNRILANMGRELNPASTIIDPGDNNAGKTIGDRISAIEAKMYTSDGKENPEYWKGAAGEALQKEYRDLLDAQTKMKARGQAG